MKNILLRLFMLVVGRFFPDLVRRLLQRLLITGRAEAPFRFRRTFDIAGLGLTVRDEVWCDRDWSEVAQAGIGGFQTSVTTVMARVFRVEQLQPWLDLNDNLRELKRGEPLVLDRRFGGS